MESARDSEAKLSSEELRDSDASDVDLDSATRQLQEFIPGISARAATTIKRMYRDDLGRFKEFKAQGEPGGNGACHFSACVAGPPFSLQRFRAVAPQAALSSSRIVRVESLARWSVRVFLFFS